MCMTENTSLAVTPMKVLELLSSSSSFLPIPSFCLFSLLTSVVRSSSLLFSKSYSLLHFSSPSRSSLHLCLPCPPCFTFPLSLSRSDQRKATFCLQRHSPSPPFSSISYRQVFLHSRQAMPSSQVAKKSSNTCTKSSPAIEESTKKKGRQGGGATKQEKKTSSSSSESSSSASSFPPFLRAVDGGVTIAVHAKPGAKQAGITSVDDQTSGQLGVQIDSPAREGEANERLCEYLSEVLDVKKRQVSLQSGHKARDKVVFIETSQSPVEIYEKLKKYHADNHLS
ncbi:family cog1872 domain-containing protein [Cystoisospora suis]|uniref:Family cog1872 domain-containing protein n=1 Tax=Cystoisospora suis TaxID=483139 RepID=A0A2C6L0D2_9APIC|nr:family cog1872 domain-containing protein [Cystoisospora suis]